MKVCSNCGHENRDDAARCDECGWTVPILHRYARIGKVLKTLAGAAIVMLVLFQFVSCTVIRAKGGGGEYGIYGAVFEFYSWRTFLVAMVLASALFWVGDYLKRTY
jgi:uncharacterized paraquat-inducible protein A